MKSPGWISYDPPDHKTPVISSVGPRVEIYQLFPSLFYVLQKMVYGILRLVKTLLYDEDFHGANLMIPRTMRWNDTSPIMRRKR